MWMAWIALGIGAAVGFAAWRLRVAVRRLDRIVAEERAFTEAGDD